MPGITDNETSLLPLLYIDTAGCDLQELDLLEEISKGNEGTFCKITPFRYKDLTCYNFCLVAIL
jgi:hypothetical protein